MVDVERRAGRDDRDGRMLRLAERRAARRTRPSPSGTRRPAASGPSATRAASPCRSSTTSANARSRPIRNLSSSLPSATSAFDCSSVGHRDDAVERLDEVRVDARPVEAERAAVERAQLRRAGRRCGRPGLLPEELERHRRSRAPLEELAPQVGVLVVEAAPERRHRARALLLDAAHLRAEVRRLEVHRDAARLRRARRAVGDLLAEPLLHGEAARVEADEPRQLRDAEDLAAGDVRRRARRRGTAARGARRARRTRSALRRSGCARRRRRRALGRERRAQLRVAVSSRRSRRTSPAGSAAACRACPGVSRSMPNAAKISPT